MYSGHGKKVDDFRPLLEDSEDEDIPLRKIKNVQEESTKILKKALSSSHLLSPRESWPKSFETKTKGSSLMHQSTAEEEWGWTSDTEDEPDTVSKRKKGKRKKKRKKKQKQKNKKRHFHVKTRMLIHYRYVGNSIFSSFELF